MLAVAPGGQASDKGRRPPVPRCCWVAVSQHHTKGAGFLTPRPWYASRPPAPPRPRSFIDYAEFAASAARNPAMLKHLTVSVADLALSVAGGKE